MGCLIAATIGHFLIDKLFPLPEPPSQAIVLLIDTSNSMETNGKIDNVKSAAIAFSQNLDEKDNLAVVGFGSEATLITSLTRDKNQVEEGIKTLETNGLTQMDLGLEKAIEELEQRPESTIPTILLFTDGEPVSAQDSLTDAEVVQFTKENAIVAKNLDIKIMGVATEGADFSLLEEIATKPEWVFSATSNPAEIQGAFQEAEKAIKSLINLDDAAGGKNAELISFLQVSTWSALLALGAALGMILAQNYYLHGKLVLPSQAMVAFAGSFAAGFIAGGLGQFIYTMPALGQLGGGELGRIVGWTMLGGLLGFGTSFFIPNLKPVYASLGGSIGGVVGALGFILMAQAFGDVAGRIFGAGFIGLSLGCAIALVEAVFREAWLDVIYGRNEIRTVTLGRESVSFGSDSKACTIYIANVEPIAGRFRLEKGQILYEEVPTGQLQRLTPGVKKHFGRVEVLVRGTEERREGGNVSSGSVVTLTSSSDKFALKIQGKTIPLVYGDRIAARLIPGLTAQTEANIVAEVNSNPENPRVLGLKNLSRQSWSATTAAGDNRVIDPGRSLKIAIGTRIDFGEVSGEILGGKR